MPHQLSAAKMKTLGFKPRKKRTVAAKKKAAGATKLGSGLPKRRRVKKKAGMRLGGATVKRKRRTNPWLVHVKKVMAANKGKLTFKQILKKAKASYKR